MSNRTTATIRAYERAMRPRDPSDIEKDRCEMWVEKESADVAGVLANVASASPGWEQQMVELAERMQREVAGAMEGTVRR